MKHYGKLTAAATAGFMALNVLNIAPVFAEENTTVINPDADGNYPITKTLTLADGDNIKPANGIEFGFSLSVPSTGYTEYDSAKTDGYGPETEFYGLKDNDGVKGISVTAAVANDETTKKEYKTKLVVTPTEFEHPGIYVYELTENAVPTDDQKYEGITDDNPNEKYIIKVTIGYAADGTTKKVLSVVAAKDGTTKLGNIAFDAKYDPSTLTVTKVTSGNQDVAGTEFTFTLKVEGQEGETYTWTTYNANKAQQETGDLTSNTNTTKEGIKLQNGWYIEVKGLSNNDKYTLTETNAKGYTPDEINGVAQTFGTTDQKKDIQFKNKKDGTVPTGILMSAAPFAGLIGLGGVFAGLFFRRKRED